MICSTSTDATGATENRCFCCSTKTAWSITALAGAIITAFGVVAILSLSSGNLGPMRNWMLKAAAGIGTSPIVLPIVITSIGGAVLLSAILGYAKNRCDNQQQPYTAL